ncbi:response regulator transcription factor [Streptomyces sp. NPDC004647]|uniref:response regulator transcription factor n=1 Tax=Streptomyces sp. NPDC004647 TaxID=3154671 RepID=UPI0033A1956E
MNPNAAGERDLPVRPSGWRVLVVESDRGDARVLTQGLRRQGHDVSLAKNGSEALDAFGGAELVLIDLDLPDFDGLEVCRSIRAVCDTPLIVVTGRESELDRVLGLQAGADDYLVKPYGFRELMARIEAVMRRITPRSTSADVVAHGRLRIDMTSRQVTWDGKDVQLTPKEFKLLHLLASQPGSVIPRKQIMVRIWGGSWSLRTLDTHVSSLRSKLGTSESIITVRGVGFRLGDV